MSTIAPPYRGGHAPYGWVSDRGRLVDHPTEQHVRWLVLHMHRQGFSLARIAGELHSLNIPTRDGADLWGRTTLHRIVATARQLGELERLPDTG